MEKTSVHELYDELYDDVYRGSAGVRTEEAAPRVHLSTDANFVPSMSGVSSTQEVDKNKS